MKRTRTAMTRGPARAAMTPAQLKKLMNVHDVRPKALAVKLNVSRSTINRWIAGDTPISTANKLLIQSVLI